MLIHHPFNELYNEFMTVHEQSKLRNKVTVPEQNRFLNS